MADALELILWVKPDCDACERARELMASLSAAMLFDWSEQEGEFGDAVPVVATADGRVLAQAPIRPGDLVDAIVAATARD
ncbi:MAG: hypothetical protein OXN86_01955 [Chloroflexota bacterium]|nr:hypothetical protein [Chloroflexota bacterium]MDE2891257.1 hypothetical protein [Chloroflexota bacterium]